MMSIKFPLKGIVTLLFAIMMGLFVVGFPYHYSAGFLLVLSVCFLWIKSPFVFILFLLIFRAGIDPFLISIRLAGIGLGGLLCLALTAGALLHFLAVPQKNYRLRLPVVYLFVVFCLVMLANVFISYDKMDAIQAMIRVSSILAIFCFVRWYVTTEKQAILLVKSIIWSVVLPVVLGAFIGFSHGRFSGTLGHPNILAYFLIIIIGCLAFQLYRSSAKRYNVIDFVALLLLTGILVLTKTRSGWLAFLILIGAYALFYQRKLIIPMLFLVVMAGFLPPVQERVANVFNFYGGNIVLNKNASMFFRIEQWRELFIIALNKPIFGYGYNADMRLAPYQGLAAHNDYLRFFVNAGIIGVISYFSLFICVLRDALKVHSLPWSSLKGRIAKFLVCFILAFLVMSISENLASYIIIQWYFWAIVAVFYSLKLDSGEYRNVRK